MSLKQIILLATEHSPSPCKSRSHCSSHMHEPDVNEATRISLHEDFLQGRGLDLVRRHVLNARTTRTRVQTATASSAAEAAGCGHQSRPSRRTPGTQNFCLENLKLVEFNLYNITYVTLLLGAILYLECSFAWSQGSRFEKQARQHIARAIPLPARRQERQRPAQRLLAIQYR